MFLVRMGERQRALGEGMCLFQAPGQQMRLPQGETTGHLVGYSLPCHGLLHCLRK